MAILKELNRIPEEARKSIKPLSAAKIVLDTAIIALMGIATIRPNIVWQFICRHSYLAFIAFAVFLILFSVTHLLCIHNIVFPIIVIENKLFHRSYSGKTDYVKRKKNIYSKKKPLFAVYTYLNSIIDENETKAEREYSLAILRKQAELKALQNQINPHFLYNTLDCIRGMALEYGANDIEEMTKALSGMFRYSISRKEKNKALLEEEMANVNDYLRIQQYRFRNKILVKENVEPMAKKCCVPKLLMQPIVENAVFYGLEPKNGERNLTIDAYCTAKRLIIKVADNGIGMSVDKLKTINDALINGIRTKSNGKGTQLGMANVNERIKMMYGDEFGLRVFSCPEIGTTVEIVLPIVTEAI